jgi:hypothetical protein
MSKHLESRFGKYQAGSGALFKIALSCLWGIDDRVASVSYPASLPALFGAFQT